MKDNRLKEEFMAIEIPEMKTGILTKIHRENYVRPRRKMRPAAIAVIAAMLALFGITVGAGTSGMLNLQNGSRYSFMDADGNTVKPTGFHLEEDVDVPLSEKAMDNITPYIHLPLTDEEIISYNTVSPEEMEEFLDMPLVLPENIEKEAILYELRVYGTDGNAVTIYLRVQTEENPDAMRVYLRGTPGVIMTAGEPEMEEYTLPDGTPVKIAVAKYQEGGLIAHALYRKNDAVYHVRVFADGKRELMENVRAILDTVG